MQTTMKKTLIKLPEILNHIDGLEMDNPDELVLYVDERWNWGHHNKEQYEAIEEQLRNFSIKKEGYRIYFGWDVSGWEYWVDQQQETDSFYIIIHFRENIFPLDKIAELKEDIDQAIARAEELEISGDELRQIQMDKIDFLDFVNQWEEYYLPAIKQAEAVTGFIDKPARQQSFNEYVDLFQKDGKLTDTQANEWCIPDHLLK